MKKVIYLVLVLISGCAAHDLKPESSSAKSPSEKAEDAPVSKGVYYFQHKLISKWVFESESAFYTDLRHGNIGQLLSAAKEIVTPEYANGITIRPVVGEEAVLITFPQPDFPPNCYYAIVERTGDGFRYITYESTIDEFIDSGVYGVVGGWNSEGGHENYGPRAYRSSEDFVADVLGGH